MQTLILLCALHTKQAGILLEANSMFRRWCLYWVWIESLNMRTHTQHLYNWDLPSSASIKQSKSETGGAPSLDIFQLPVCFQTVFMIVALGSIHGHQVSFTIFLKTMAPKIKHTLSKKNNARTTVSTMKYLFIKKMLPIYHKTKKMTQKNMAYSSTLQTPVHWTRWKPCAFLGNLN